jgi:SAM-dependent methyltransferase
VTISDDLQRLNALPTSSPYPSEPPRRSRRVEVLMRLSTMLGARTPYPNFIGRGLDLPQSEYDYDNRNFWHSFRGVVTPESMRNSRVLDIGCGWGGKTVWYAEHTGLQSIGGFDLPGVFDPSVAMEFATAHEVADKCEFKTGYAEEIPYESSAFDFAVMDDVLEHVSDPRTVLSECSRVLTPGGILVCRFPSIKMVKAHHFDRATTLPGMHYLANMKVWAGGLNHYLLHNRAAVRYDPFPRVKQSDFGTAVTSDLSGLDLRAFEQLVAESPFEPTLLTLTGVPAKRLEDTPSLVAEVYERLRSMPILREALSSSIAFVGTYRA